MILGLRADRRGRRAHLVPAAAGRGGAGPAARARPRLAAAPPAAASTPAAGVVPAPPSAALTTRALARRGAARPRRDGAGAAALRRRARAGTRDAGRSSAFLAAPPGVAPPRILDEVGARALRERRRAARTTTRPLLAAAAADLVAKRPQRALEHYRAALALGERAETDLNAGRAFAMLDQRPDAFAAFVRAGWLSPYLIPAMPAAAQPLVEAEVARRAAALQDGTLLTPPPLPDALRATAGAVSGTPPRLSVVVPTHDTRALTELCFRALAAAAPPSCELILVDDASSDGTAAAIARAYPGVRIVRLEGPQGFTAAANAGLAAATGEILLLLNSDTEVAPGALTTLLAAFAANPWLGVAGAELCAPDGTPRWSGGAAPGLRWLFVLGTGLAAVLGRLPGWRRVKQAGATAGVEVDWVSGAALALRREVWVRTGALDGRFRFYCQDVDLCLRARDLGWQVMIVPGARVVHHEGATIGKRGGAVAQRYHAELLWTDLVRLVAKRFGPRAARRARCALLTGATLRVLARRGVTPLLPRARRGAWRRDTRGAGGRRRGAASRAGHGRACAVGAVASAGAPCRGAVDVLEPGRDPRRVVLGAQPHASRRDQRVAQRGLARQPRERRRRSRPRSRRSAAPVRRARRGRAPPPASRPPAGRVPTPRGCARARPSRSGAARRRSHRPGTRRGCRSARRAAPCPRGWSRGLRRRRAGPRPAAPRARPARRRRRASARPSRLGCQPPLPSATTAGRAGGSDAPGGSTRRERCRDRLDGGAARAERVQARGVLVAQGDGGGRAAQRARLVGGEPACLERGEDAAAAGAPARSRARDRSRRSGSAASPERRLRTRACTARAPAAARRARRRPGARAAAPRPACGAAACAWRAIDSGTRDRGGGERGGERRAGSHRHQVRPAERGELLRDALEVEGARVAGRDQIDRVAARRERRERVLDHHPAAVDRRPGRLGHDPEEVHDAPATAVVDRLQRRDRRVPAVARLDQPACRARHGRGRVGVAQQADDAARRSAPCRSRAAGARRRRPRALRRRATSRPPACRTPSPRGSSATAPSRRAAAPPRRAPGR